MDLIAHIFSIWFASPVVMCSMIFSVSPGESHWIYVVSEGETGLGYMHDFW